ncbi:SgcJ/EcaC family oxidoreductase [Pseudomonas sp. NPDC089752]|uniref:SgcJ/EcaC family oxidoreductase n=1 Tax=Pseudomonas sp. NPDC089752 TaxID=3364472 RepID=UPI003824196E
MSPSQYLATAALLAIGMHAHAAAPEQCQPLTEHDALGLFAKWNTTLQTGDPAQVADLYHEQAVLLPTVSKTPRLTRDERIDYFRHFLADRPSGKLDSHHLQTGCNTATLAGLYTFDYASTGKQVAARYTYTYRWDGQNWMIKHHHSSVLPQG